ncbi:MAG: hypothetical protein AMS26_17125 [Bacteroides sp. SM23_62]|nr:MAG: hypothetical protein AMS26_17125 [Bacteroides sp. SM23_62]
MEDLPVIYYGSREAPVPARILHAGSLTCLYQAGALRQIRAGKTEILRMIYPAIRDHNWGTVPGIISGEQIEAHEDSFSIRYSCRYCEGDIDYLSTVRINGTKENSLTFSLKGKALSSFRKNRIGLNVLHPIRECAGRMCKVITPEGRQYSAEFPVDISPRQPMKNIRSLTWTLEGDIHATLELSGEVFEMEDQRNWTDASYKTYCTPLELPFPASLEKGEILGQEVQLKVEVQEIHSDSDDQNRVILPEYKTLSSFPSLGICRSNETGPLSKPDLALISKAGFRHYRVDLHLYRQGWHGILAEGVNEAIYMGLALELALFFGDEPSYQLAALVSQVKKYAFPVGRFLLFTKDHLNDAALSGTVVPVLKKEFPGTAVGSGTNGNFAELNRNRPDPDHTDFLTYSINPQVHASDPLSLVENLAGQQDTVLTARSFPGDKPVCISPVTLKSRFNIAATSVETQDRGPKSLPASVDQRQPSLFCAGWTLGSIKYLAESGVDAVTYYETAGRRGIIHGDHQSLSPGDFMAVRGDIYPVYFLFRELSKFRDYNVRTTESSHPLRFSCTLLEGTGQILILANHTATIQPVHLQEGMQIQGAWVLDENTIADLRSGRHNWRGHADPAFVSLNPLAIAFLKLI